MSIKTIFAALAATLALTACEGVWVDLCAEQHPHSTDITFEYDWAAYRQSPVWEDVDQDIKIETQKNMFCLAHRVIGQGKRIIRLDTRTNPAKDGAGRATFNLRTGWYKFVTYNQDNDSFEYSDVDDYLNDTTGTLTLQSLNIRYKAYERGDKDLRVPDIIVEGKKQQMSSWIDYNPYNHYVQPDVQPIWFDTLTTRELVLKQPQTLTFHPQPLTQNIDITFDIKKGGQTEYTIETVACEIAGLPKQINLANAYIDITDTYKMIFATRLENTAGAVAADRDDSRATVRAHGNIDVTSIVCSQNSELRTGPGIMQVMIYVSTYWRTADGRLIYGDDGQPLRLHKKIQGKINLYNTLSKAQLYAISDDGTKARRNGLAHKLHINCDLTIDGNTILKNSDNNGGLDVWEPCGDVILDI